MNYSKIKLYLIIFVILISSLGYSQDFQNSDTIVEGSYNFHLSNKKMHTELVYYTLKYKNNSDNSIIEELYSPDSTLETRTVYHKNIEKKDSVKYIYVNEILTDSCMWQYDSFKRETFYLLHSIYNKEHEILNWIYEYKKDTSYNDTLITTKVEYRIDQGINYIDTCCRTTTISTFKNGLLIKQIEKDKYEETVIIFHYDRDNILLKKSYFIEGDLIYEINQDKNNNCEREYTIIFPKSLSIANENEINSLAEKYWKHFNHKKCKSEVLILNSKDNLMQISIFRGLGHTPDTGRVKYRIVK